MPIHSGTRMGPSETLGLRDADIRPRLREWLCRAHAEDASTIVIDELGIRRGSVRVDLAVVNGVTHGYEIKAKLDSLKRLPEQVRVYSEVLDAATLVTVPEHLEKAMKIVPRWWEIMICTDDGFTQIRKGKSNPNVRARAVVELIWREEALELLRARGALKGLPSTRRRDAWDRLCKVMSKDEVRATVRELLRVRSRERASVSSS